MPDKNEIIWEARELINTKSRQQAGRLKANRDIAKVKESIKKQRCPLGVREVFGYGTTMGGVVKCVKELCGG
jgi:hypothetical protein